VTEARESEKAADELNLVKATCEFSAKRNELNELNLEEAATNLERSICPETDV
jgi:hypothetical protein